MQPDNQPSTRESTEQPASTLNDIVPPSGAQQDGFNDPITQLILFLRQLQQAALSPLQIQHRSRQEVESRESDLSSLIEHMSDDVQQGIDVIQSIQKNLSTSRESNLANIAKDLNSTRNTLNERQAALKSVMAELEMIGRQLSMLAMNAKIEASRAGESEAGFSVVADEVKRLARTAIEHSAQASNLFDLSSVNSQLEEVVENFQASNARTESEFSEAFGDVVGVFAKVTTSLDDVSEHYSVISEVASNNETAIERSRGKLAWARLRTGQAADLLCTDETESLDDTRAGISQLLLRDGVHSCRTFDRLESIQTAGIIRVAIEPSFVGLSFRKGNGEPLIGLDVEYAQALASYLGVQCEFVEAPWDTLTELLHVGRQPDEFPADIVISALPPSDSYDGVAYSETYTYLNWVLARQVGNKDINSLADLDGKRLGIINDPGAFILLENQGVRWHSNQHAPGGKIFLKDLIAYSDQSRIHDCLTEGVVDAFGVDMPIYHWACTDKASPWHGKIEICSDNLAGDPYYYCMAVAAAPSSYQLLHAANQFIDQHKKSTDRLKTEQLWQGSPIKHSLSYRDEAGNLPGEEELRHIWAAHQKQYRLNS